MFKSMKVFNEYPWLADIREKALFRYWQTICMDGLLGNFDRHSGNWGYLLERQSMRLVDNAPVYDCGSCLYPRLNEQEMQRFRDNPESLRERVLAFPTLKLTVDGARPSYLEFLMSEKGRPARDALLGLYLRIDMTEICNLIKEVPGISHVKREFYSTLIETRKDVILTPAYEKALAERKSPAKRSSCAKEAANRAKVACKSPDDIRHHR